VGSETPTGIYPPVREFIHIEESVLNLYRCMPKNFIIFFAKFVNGSYEELLYSKVH